MINIIYVVIFLWLSWGYYHLLKVYFDEGKVVTLFFSIPIVAITIMILLFMDLLIQLGDKYNF